MNTVEATITRTQKHRTQQVLNIYSMRMLIVTGIQKATATVTSFGVVKYIDEKKREIHPKSCYCVCTGCTSIHRTMNRINFDRPHSLLSLRYILHQQLPLQLNCIVVLVG
mmetsp:Transcript_7610/g.8810  ORF Transcript_7610/g.8810 Transcript_7610/m.8810 type:complete len:110 (+) Transcript_7610:112-441(+)